MNGSARDAASEPVVPEVVRSPGSEDVPVQGPPLTPLSPTESLLGALLGAVPEVAQHVVRAAQELLLAAKALVEGFGGKRSDGGRRRPRGTGVPGWAG